MIHVLFSSSAAGTLRQLLGSRGTREKVVDLTECLDVGPISSGSVDDRIRWFDERLPWKGNWDWAAECVHEFLAEVNSDDDRLVWLAPRSAHEQSGFLWYLHQLRGAPARMILANHPVARWRDETPRSLGELDEGLMADLLDHAPRPEWDGSRFPSGRWRTLMDDGAVLRIVEDGVLKSAPADHYDQCLVQWCPTQWTKFFRVIGDTMGRAGQHVDYLYLQWRLQELIAAGVIECDGDLPRWDLPSTRMPVRVRRAA